MPSSSCTDKPNVVANLSLAPHVYKNLQKAEIAALIALFREIQHSWAVEQLCLPSNTVGEYGQPMLMGMAGMAKYPKAPYWYSWRMRVAEFPEEAWRFASLPCATPQQRATSIPRLSVEEQKACIRSAAGNSIATLDRMMINARKHEFTHLVIEDDFAQSRDTQHFVDRLFSRLQRENQTVQANSERLRTDRDGVVTMTRSSVIECFFLYLAEKQIAYLPFRMKAFAGDPRGLDLFLLCEQTKSLWQRYLDAYSAHFTKEYDGTAETLRGSVQKRWVPVVRNTFFAFVMATSLRTDEPESKDIFDAIASKVEKGDRMQALRLLQRTLGSIETGKLASPQNYTRRATLTSRFEWIYSAYDAGSARQFPKFVPTNYKPHSNMQAWVEILVEDVKRLETKDTNNALAAYSNFVVWLAWSGRCTTIFEEISREDINDGRLYDESDCFRAFLIKKGLIPLSVNGIISRMAAFYGRVIQRRQLQIVNPISVRFDRVRATSRRGRTPRLPLGRDTMEYIRELNERNDFAFSKADQTHYRVVSDPATGRLRNIWFPAPALLIDFLLRMPARSFQARYVDSGEADELLPDFDNELRYERNASPLATKGRREFVLTVMQGLDSQPILGLYFNTNKTSVDRALGYEVAWCDASLRDNLLFMRDWQMRYNQITAPIICAEHNRQPENQDVRDAVQKAFPLFRDPAEPGHHPPDRATLKRYWDNLLGAVEDEINLKAGRTVLRLTETKQVSKGVERSANVRVALYDIHTLRVSGITALIEAGLPPDMVMQIAGHSTIVMTLYYNKVSASRLNRALTDAMERAAASLVETFGDDDDDAYLINSREQEDQAGLEMWKAARGRGSGSVDFMAHGICPGGECETGGEWTNQAVGYMPVPRPNACSLCRYRLTGPMFLPGLVLNANRLMHEWNAVGNQIADLNDRIGQEGTAGRNAHTLKSQCSALYHQSNAIAREWAAEITYVKMCEQMLETYLADDEARAAGDQTSSHLPIISGIAQGEVFARLEQRSQFALLQALSDGAQEWVGFQPQQALIDHREVLNEILEANDLRPFLLRLSGPARDKAANLLGRAIVACVPDGDIESLRTGAVRLGDYPAVLEALSSIETNVLSGMRAATVPKGRNKALQA